ncbi:MAG: hypothetical protein ACREX0_14520 [Noviherbaspirillum sp.]
MKDVPLIISVLFISAGILFYTAVQAWLVGVVVFLLPGQQSMLGKAAFAEAAQAMSGQHAPQFDGKSEIQEIKTSYRV